MSIEYRSNPKHVKDLIQQHASRFVGWDLDGTLVNTERLHRALCRSALQEIGNTIISEREFSSPLFRAAFGLPGGETSVQLANTLRLTNPEGFEHALRVALSMGITGDSCDTVGQAITRIRQQTFAFYIQHATLSRSNEHGGVLRLALPSSSPISDAQSSRRFAALKDIHVHTYPYVLEALETFQRHGLTQGLCTSSGKDFVYPLIGALALQSYFKAIVTADCVPAGYHKPAPYPWHHLRSKLDADKPFSDDTNPIADMICIENSAGGGLSAMRASKSPTFVIADNIAATVGKLHAKIRALDDSSSGGNIHGTATFIDDLGALVVPRTSASYRRQSPAKRAAPEAVGSAAS